MTNDGTIRRVTAAAVCTAALTLAWPAAAGIKCWKNSEGVRECGNAVPPEYAQGGHKELSSQGVTVGGAERAKTGEELAAEREAAKQVERDRTEAERAAREKAAHDRVLLDTFTTEEDLLLARDSKLEAIDSRIKHTGQVTIRLEETLEGMQSEAARLERAGKPVPDDLLASIRNLEGRITENQSLIARRHTEKRELAARFDADLLRYRELKGRQ